MIVDVGSLEQEVQRSLHLVVREMRVSGFIYTHLPLSTVSVSRLEQPQRAQNKPSS